MRITSKKLVAIACDATPPAVYREGSPSTDNGFSPIGVTSEPSVIAATPGNAETFCAKAAANLDLASASASFGSLTEAVNMWSVRYPSGVDAIRHRLAANNPGPTKSMSESAICNTTSVREVLFAPPLAPVLRSLSLSAAFKSTPEERHAGNKPKISTEPAPKVA